MSAVLEPDCNHNGLGDETQEKNVSGPGCPATGRRAAALKKCKKKKRSISKLGTCGKCRKKAKKLPV